MVKFAPHNFTMYGLTSSLRDEYFRACKLDSAFPLALFLVVEERVNMLTRRDEFVQVPHVDLVAGMPVPDIFIIPIVVTSFGRQDPRSLQTR